MILCWYPKPSNPLNCVVANLTDGCVGSVDKQFGVFIDRVGVVDVLLLMFERWSVSLIYASAGIDAPVGPVDIYLCTGQSGRFAIIIANI